MHSIIIAIIYWARKMDTICAGHLWTAWWPEHSRAAVLIFLDKAAQCSHARVTLFTSLQWSATLIALWFVSTPQLHKILMKPCRYLEIFLSWIYSEPQENLINIKNLINSLWHYIYLSQKYLSGLRDPLEIFLSSVTRRNIFNVCYKYQDWNKI